DANGEYSFDNLSPETYTVAEVQQSGWTQTSPAIGILGEVFNADFSDTDGDPDLDGFTIDNTGGAVAGLWHLSTGRGNQPGHSADDSLYFGTGEGVDGGGNYDVGHTAGRVTSPVIDLTGIGSAELSFNYILASEGGNPWDSARVLISQDGGVFEPIASNVSELVDPTTGWTNATVDLSAYAGSNIEIRFDFDTIDSIGNNFEGWYVDDIVVTEVGNGTYTLELNPDEAATNINFGNAELQPGEIHGYKWNDEDGDGEWDGNESALSGWTIYLDDNHNGELDEDEQSAITDANGEYSFTELVPGTYTIAEVQQDGWTQTSPDGSNNSIEPDDYTNGTLLNTIQPGVTLSAVGSGVSNNQVLSQTSIYSSTGTQNFNNSASYWYKDVAELRADFDTATSSVSIDFISDDSSDIGQLEAYDADGNLLETYTTAVLTTGQSETMTVTRDSADIAYILATGQDGLSFGYLDNLVFSSSDFHIVEVGDGEIVTDINFGNQQIIPAEIHGIKWNDINGNGSQDADELGLEGWTIYLDDNQNGQLDVGEESTVTDANGEYAFTNLAGGTYTVAEEPQSGWQQTFPVLNTPISSTLIPVANRRDLVFDDSRNLLYITTTDGDLERYDPSTQTLITPWDVGNVLHGADITPDSSTLYLAEGQRGATQGFIRKLNLDTGNVTNLTYNLDFGEGGAWDINIGANGKALFTTIFEGSGWTPLREIDLSNDAMTIRTDSLGSGFGGEVTGGSRIYRSRDRHFFFFTEANISSGPIFTYDAVTDTFPNSAQTNAFLSRGAAVNRDGSLMALRLGSGVSVFDRDFNSIENLSNVGAGLVFDPIGDVLYAADADADEVVAFDTETWDELYRLDIGENINAFDFIFTGMEVSDDGQLLFLGTPSGVRMFDLSASSTPIPHTIELNTGEIRTGIDFGNQEQRGTISGSKWSDLDGDGIRDTGEPGLANWTIYLDDNNNGQLDTDETSTTTDELGNYSFSLEPGTYTVAEVLEPDWVQTYPIGGTHTVALATAEDVSDINFGNRPALNAIIGTSADDELLGTPIPDDIRGLDGNDRLFGRQDEDTLRGNRGDDSLYGGGGDDNLLGNLENDVLYGGKGNDNLQGGPGADVLTGINILDALPGLGEIDQLQGNADIDTFVLADSDGTYYNDGDDLSFGFEDYGFILDFTVGEDVIRLSGGASAYFLAESPTGLPSGTAIFLATETQDELIGIVRNVPLAQLDLTGSSFSYV
ncbi:MAG TPA: choice-of-anchor J domain-containing protein, partial [Oscillatoriales cyanobacterium M59_W2019_021]|nr:choice-of-anchor J domain-containing protein [Oscillatoriales cyanobacterium M59_W2019_021]